MSDSFAWTVVHQTSLSMGFPRQENWSGFPFPSPRALPDPGIESVSPVSPSLASEFFTTTATWETHIEYYLTINMSELKINEYTINWKNLKIITKKKEEEKEYMLCELPFTESF